MRQVVRADMYDEISILKSLRYRKSNHPEGATKDHARRVGPNANNAETDLNRTTDSASEDHRGIVLRIHFRSTAFEWYFRSSRFLTSILRYFVKNHCTFCSDVEHMDEQEG